MITTTYEELQIEKNSCNISMSKLNGSNGKYSGNNPKNMPIQKENNSISKVLIN
jgi:hypothetical protein